jgi:branched-chain amino acid transport system substrate-binding protein
LLALAGLAAILASACGGPTPPNTPQADIKMLYAIALTGGIAQLGQNACNGAKMAADDINAQGGVSKGSHKGAKLVVECIDNEQSPSATTTLANKYVADSSYWTMMGFYGSGEGQAAALVAQRSNLSIIGSNIGASFLTEAVHNVLVMIPPLQALGYSWVDFCKSYYGASKIADLSPNYSYIPDYRKGRDKAINGGVSGVSLVSEQTYDDSTTQDFSPYLSKIKASGAQCLLLGSYPASQCKITAQARSMGLNIPVVDFTDSGTNQQCAQAAGRSFTGMAFGDYLTFPAPAGSALEKAANQFKAKFSQPFGSYPAYSYDGVQAVKCAIEDGANTREELLTYLPKINCPGVTGQLKFIGNRPGERVLTREEATGTTVDSLEAVAYYIGKADGTATLTKLAAGKCADRPTCKFMLGT